MEENQRYFYAPDGKKYGKDEVKKENGYEVTHSDIAKKIINDNPQYLKEFNELKKRSDISETKFVLLKGYIYVGGRNIHDMLIMYSAVSLNDTTKRILGEFKATGYDPYNILNEILKPEQINEIRSWKKNGMAQSDIINKVLKEMIASKVSIDDKSDDSYGLE